jgi:acyl-CoA thioesterase I
MKKIVLFIALVLLYAFPSCTNPNNKNETRAESTEAASRDSLETPARKKVILFFGNSITAAYGLEPNESFTTLIQARLDSLGGNYEVINAGVSGETTATGSNRVTWVIERQPVDIFVLELGANDGLRGVPVKETKANLEKIIDIVRNTHPEVKIILAGMMVPPSMGPDYSRDFQKIFPEVAREKNVALIPFILENVAGIDTLNLADGIHPNATGEKIVMENVWRVLETMLVD